MLNANSIINATKEGIKNIGIGKIFIYAALMIWLNIYIFCDYLPLSIEKINILRAALNIAMCVAVVIFTFIDRYSEILKKKNFEHINSSKISFLTFGMAIVPFATAVTDMMKVSDSYVVINFMLFGALFVNLTELTLVIKYGKKGERYIKLHCALVLFNILAIGLFLNIA